MLKPNCDVKEFKKYGFKKCKGIPKDSECYYLCVARGCKMLFVSNVYFGVSDWNKNDPFIQDQTADTEIIKMHWILYMI